MQEFLHFLRETAPLSLLLHITVTFATKGIILIMFLGHSLAQSPQPTQRFLLTLAIESSIQIALEGQTAAQSPQPKQPYVQLLGPA
jgi:hypothetical protein